MDKKNIDTPVQESKAEAKKKHEQLMLEYAKRLENLAKKGEEQ